MPERARLLQRLQRALHNPHAAPPEQAWNQHELQDLLALDAPRMPAAVLLALRAEGDGFRLLLTERSAGLRHHGGQISFPGGRIECDDAHAMAAALRETREEIGIPEDLIEPAGFLDTYDTITGYRVHPLVGLIRGQVALRPDPREVASVFEVPLEFVLDPANLQRREAHFRGRMRHYFAFEYQGRTIWGATAAMLVNLSQRLAASS